MKQLFLCSYFVGVKDLFRQYASEKQLGNQVLFIPTAGNVEDYRGVILTKPCKPLRTWDFK